MSTPFRALFVILIAAGLHPDFASAQSDSDSQIARAVLAAPESIRDDATVLGYGGEAREGDSLTTLRVGSNGVICLADDPDSEGFHVACYHESLDPYMRLGRRLRAEGADRGAVMDARFAALESGEIEAPAAALWSVTSQEDVEPGAALPEGVRRLSVIYVPYAEGATLGLPTRPDGDSPWLMLPGTPWAHVMIPR
jgi:hypothetical protein